MTSILKPFAHDWSGCLCIPVLVIHYGTPKETIRCLSSLRLNSPNQSILIFVVDNCSPDKSGHQIKERTDLYSFFFEEERNLGFTAAVNAFLKNTGQKDVILINSDAYVAPGWFEPLVELAHLRRDMGMVFPRLVQPTDRKTRDGLPCAHCSPNHFIEDDVFYYKDWSSFACVMITRRMIDKIGLLDERHFNYGSDKEYGLRATAAGWRLSHTDDSIVYHEPSTSYKKYREIVRKLEDQHNMGVRTRDYLKKIWNP